MFSISYYIAEHFPNTKSLIIPILVDVEEYEYVEKTAAKYKSILVMNSMMKDSIESTLLG